MEEVKKQIVICKSCGSTDVGCETFTIDGKRHLVGFMRCNACEKAQVLGAPLVLEVIEVDE